MRLSIMASVIALSASTVVAFDKIILYADSYSDNGNDYKNSNFPPSPPYWQGRFTNGPTWAEYVAKNISIPFINNGYGGATTNNEDSYSRYNNWTVPGLKQQIDTIPTNGTAKDLYIIEIGYNDLNSIINPGQYNIVNKNYTYQKVGQNVVDGVHALINKYGAKEFLFFNVPPFDQWPVVNTTAKPAAKTLINSYNAYVKAKLKKNVKNAHLRFIDSHAWFAEQLAHPEKFGLSTTNGPCIKDISDPTSACSDPEKHFFIDLYHPEAKVHDAWGKLTTKQLNEFYGIK